MNLPWPFTTRRRAIIDQPFPDSWLPYLTSNVKHYDLLTPAEQERLRGDLRIVMAEKNWEGAMGFVVTDEVKVTISGLASLLTVGFERHDYFPDVESIVVYADTYVVPNAIETFGPMVKVADSARLGEAHGRGPVILSWSDLVEGGRDAEDGHNLVFHEFAHKLDFRDGSANGVPYLRDNAAVETWSRVMAAEYQQLQHDLAHHGHTLLRAYGATDAAEFFAVCTECFFELPVRMRREKPELYDVLADYYRIDWAERFSAR